jgi:hypothetical protein
MKIRTILPAVAATVLMTVAGAAATEAQTSGAYGQSAAQSQQDRRDERRQDRRDRRDQAVSSSSSTYGAGQVETSRDRTRATVVSGGEARGPGSTSASSTVDAYGETYRDGSSADIYGGSTANANEPRRERRPN